MYLLFFLLSLNDTLFPMFFYITCDGVMGRGEERPAFVMEFSCLYHWECKKKKFLFLERGLLLFNTQNYLPSFMFFFGKFFFEYGHQTRKDIVPAA